MKKLFRICTVVTMIVVLTSCKDADDSAKKAISLAEQLAEADAEPTVSKAFDQAREKARKSDRRILLAFTSSDWCRFSKLMKEKVFDTKEWTTYAEANFVTYVADFPLRTKLAPDVGRLHQRLQTKYAITKYPVVLILNSDDTVAATIDFEEDDTATTFIARIKRALNPKTAETDDTPIALKGGEIHAATGVGATVDYLTKGVKPGRWSMDYAAVVKAATESGKPILFKFTGSDWCSWCKLMNSKVLKQASWQRFARRNLILFVLDFPQNTDLPADVVARNMDFQNTFGVQGFPTFVLVEPDGKSVVGFVEHDLSPHTFRDNVTEVMQLSNTRVKKLSAKLSKVEGDEYERVVEKLKKILKTRRKLHREGQTLFRRGGLTEEFEKRFMAVQKELSELHAKSRQVTRKVFADTLKPESKKRYLRLYEAHDQAEKNISEFVARGRDGGMSMEALNVHQQSLFLVRDKIAEVEFQHYHARFEEEPARTFKRLFETLQAKRASHRNWLLTNPKESPENVARDKQFRDDMAELEDRIDAMKELQLKEN